MRILIVEDECMTALDLQLLFEEYGHEAKPYSHAAIRACLATEHSLAG